MEKRKAEYYKYRLDLNHQIQFNFGNETEFDGKAAHCEKLM